MQAAGHGDENHTALDAQDAQGAQEAQGGAVLGEPRGAQGAAGRAALGGRSRPYAVPAGEWAVQVPSPSEAARAPLGGLLLEPRLAELLRLHAAGLVPDDVYRARVDQLLQDAGL